MADMREMPPPGMGHMATEVRMVLRGESRTHRFLRARVTFLAGATLLLDAIATVAMYVLEDWAITVAATLAASLAAFFHARHVEHMERETAPGSPAPFDDRGK